MSIESERIDEYFARQLREAIDFQRSREIEPADWHEPTYEQMQGDYSYNAASEDSLMSIDAKEECIERMLANIDHIGWLSARQRLALDEALHASPVNTEGNAAYPIGAIVTLKDNRHWTARPSFVVLDYRQVADQSRPHEYLVKHSDGSSVPIWVDEFEVDGELSCF
jgi:hypothetical protein